MFKAIIIDKTDAGQAARIDTLDDSDLPAGNVTVRVEYSTVNFKDGLAITGAIPLIQSFPMVPGIDFAGVVEASDHPEWKAGDRVVLNGWGVGERHWGGLAGKARVNGDWLVRLPDAFTTRQAMAIGTAGYAAMLCVLRLEKLGVKPGDGEVIVTGASGGVGSVAIAVLSKLGYRVAASTGRPEGADYLKALGAAEIIDRNTLAEPGGPMQAERWAGAIDTVGSHTLVNVCAQMRYGGIVAATGLAQGIDLPATLYPFILRNVTLSGVDSVMAPRGDREEAWSRLARNLDPAKLESMIREIALEDVIPSAGNILQGKVRGRIVVAL
ncbi:MDR family oxidoreductase [uncultured Sphingosinicella sp.]|mgnify:FL=1|uniref:acrylyl-CoA reductase (NADPH) n=1 Tax=uncultured Sphingosinicella sp. TaxID=478748 RepID=UPI0030DB506A|tara:strand:+ start:56467 stop:57444 length:978 start_codon:yes stop_codon:yes gene_type:complete